MYEREILAAADCIARSAGGGAGSRRREEKE